ncbi:uncharacterized protein [Nicotiana tomentosiformis]|uniref:uncharacterized protein n=1 Tax=Nicotiana tomentosiformis TaxID=4098 RepID=UPI00388C46BE
MVMDCPRCRRGWPLHSTKAMFAASVSTPHAQLTRGGRQVGRGCPRGGDQARCYVFPGRTKAMASDNFITGIISVCHRDTIVLFDPGSNYLYVSSYFASYLDMPRDFLSTHVYVSTTVRDSTVVDRVYLSCFIIIEGYETRVDLLLLNLMDFDMILGMDWLSLYYAILDCHAKTVMLVILRLPRLKWRGTLDHIPSRVVSFLKAQRMVEKVCLAYLAFVRDVSADTPTVESVLVVKEFPDVFPEDLPGMPPNKDINFCIDLVSGTYPISILPYRMAPVELKKLNE